MATKKRASSKKSSGKRASGSEKLNAARGAKAGASGPLQKVLTTLSKGSIINDILIRGTPRPDIIKGTITAKNSKQLNTALGALLGVRGLELKPVRLFPKGIPVIDEIVARVDGRIRGGG